MYFVSTNIAKKKGITFFLIIFFLFFFKESYSFLYCKHVHFCYCYINWLQSKYTTIILMNCQQNCNKLKTISKLGLIRIFGFGGNKQLCLRLNMQQRSVRIGTCLHFRNPRTRLVYRYMFTFP